MPTHNEDSIISVTYFITYYHDKFYFRMLNVNPEERMTIQQLLTHPWLNDGRTPSTPLQSPRHLMDDVSILDFTLLSSKPNRLSKQIAFLYSFVHWYFPHYWYTEASSSIVSGTIELCYWIHALLWLDHYNNSSTTIFEVVINSLGVIWSCNECSFCHADWYEITGSYFSPWFKCNV